MSSVCDPENFAGRVSLAASYVLQGRRTTRTFDGCFEMNDGDLVACALWRRAQKNARLAEALPRYISVEYRDKVLAEYAHIPTRKLADEARRARDSRKAGA